jgi:iron complex outermembrane receptor protein
MKKLFFILTLIFTVGITAQEIKVTGVVTDNSKGPLAGASILVKGTQNGTSADFDGKFTINAKAGDVLLFSYIGFETQSIKVTGSTVNITLKASGETLEDVVVIGSRNPARTVTESAVPIDVINMKEIASQGPQVNLNQIMNMVAPSFTSNTATIADGTDHIDPAQLRGLGPDQVLVLLNGKRRHTSSLVNINGSPGRGSVGTDLNAIPAFAIEKIEVLRDGASAQYGSDAIAGVINLNLKKATNKLEINTFAGSNFSKGANDHRGGHDGNNYQFDLNYGRKLSEKGFINFTTSLQFRDATSRAHDETNTIFNGFNAVEQRAANAGISLTSMFGNITNTPNTAQIISTIKTYAPQVSYFTSGTPTSQQELIQAATTIGQLQTILGADATAGELAYRGLERRDFNMKVGQSSLQSIQFFMNSVIPVNNKLDFYMFGGVAFRDGNSGGFYRKPNGGNTSTGLYPNGFLPEIHSTISDASFAAGLRGKLIGDWNFDLSNTLGQNSFGYTIKNTANATLRNSSPSTFNAGSLVFFQNTTNFDVNRKFKALNVAFGAEYRHENFEIVAGDPDSYNVYDINGGLVTPATPNNIKVTNFFGGYRTGGAQVFPGYGIKNAVNEGRNSYAGYLDLEYDITSKWLLNGAVRYENYSDFGNTTNYKLATRYKLTNNINLRGAVATGFRAPSLHQIYFNSTSTQFTAGVPQQVVTFKNDGLEANAFGIPSLKQEESNSYSIGFTAKIPSAKLTITADTYLINIKDRVGYTGQFTRPSTAGPLQNAFDAAGAQVAQFFANAIDTQSKGIDVVISHKLPLTDELTLKTDLSATFSKTKRIGDIHASPLLQSSGTINAYYSEANRIYLEEAIPRVKANLTNTLTYKKFDFFLRNVYFGEVTDPNTADVNLDGRIEGTIINGQVLETEHPTFGAKIITDFSVGFALCKNAKLVVGANNIFDIYPDVQLGPQKPIRPRLIAGAIDYTAIPSTTPLDLSNNGQFAYSRNVSQFGQNGRFVFARLSFKF